MTDNDAIQLGDTVEVLVDGEYKETFHIDGSQLIAHLLLGKTTGQETFMNLGLGTPRKVKIVSITHGKT